MEVLIPSEALRTGIIVGSLVYVVSNALGEVTGLFISNVGLAASVLSGGIVTCTAGSVAGVITSEAVKGLTDGLFVPIVKKSTQFSSMGLAAGASLATVAVVTLGIMGGRFVLNKIRPAQPIDNVQFDFDSFEDEGFSVVHVHSVLGNPEGTPFKASAEQKN